MEGFATVGVANLNLALYTLTVRAPGGYSAGLPELTYTFPISPQNVRKEPIALNSIYDVAGSPSTGGVQRIVDEYGIAPPMYTIRGTTGWKLHSTDGYEWTGRQSCQQVQDILAAYAALNQTQMANQQNDLYTLEFYDYFMEEFWQVVPVGPQGIEQNSDRPLMSYYTFRLAAVQPVEAPILPVGLDQVAAILAATAAGGILAFATTAAALLEVY